MNFLIYKHAFCCKIKKLKGGTLWDIKKFSKKSRTGPKKIKRGNPLVSPGFVDYVKKVKNERRDPLETEKNSNKKVAQCRKKIERGDSFVPSGFVGHLENLKKNERGDPLH